MSVARLNEFDQDEWWDVCRIVHLDLTREEYDVMWKEFCEWKQRKQQH